MVGMVKRLFLYCFILAAIALVNVRGGSLIPMHNGLGTDGYIYASMARDYHGQIFDRGVWSYAPDYYFQRSLPPAIVHYTLAALGSGFDDLALIRCFQFYNLLLLFLSVFLWEAISSRLKLSESSRWIGFFLLFINVANGWVPFYYPTLTDVWGFTATLVLLYAFLCEKSWAVLLISTVSAFIWPILQPLGLLLFLFPRSWKAAESFRFTSKQRSFLGMAAGMAIVGGVCAVAYSKYSTKYGLGLDHLSPGDPFVIGSLSLLAVYIFWVVRTVSNFPFPKPLALLKDVGFWKRALPALAVLLVVKFIVRSVVSVATNNTAIPIVMATTFTIQSPFMFFAKHVLYFGPGAAAAYVFFRRIRAEAVQFGPGLWALIAIQAVLSFDLESRHLVILFPVLVVLGVLCMDKRVREQTVLIVYAVGGLALGAFFLWPWVAHLHLETEQYHQFIWGRPDMLSWIWFGVIAATCVRYEISHSS